MLGLPKANAHCPCQSARSFADCCAPYITGVACPWQPQSLMRSRYTAYTLAKISYIKSTQAGPAADNFDAASVLRWAKSCKWLGLSIDLDHTTHEFWHSDTAKVSFTANFEQANKQRSMHEVSIFKKVAGKWYYFSHQ